MNYNTDGFNERMNYINNSNNIRNEKNEFDNSFAKMRSEERRNMVNTVDNDKISLPKETRGNINNFVVRNKSINNAGHPIINKNDPVKKAIDRNIFKNN